MCSSNNKPQCRQQFLHLKGEIQRAEVSANEKQTLKQLHLSRLQQWRMHPAWHKNHTSGYKLLLTFWRKYINYLQNSREASIKFVLSVPGMTTATTVVQKKKKKKGQEKKRKEQSQQSASAVIIFWVLQHFVTFFFSSRVHFASSQLFWVSQLPRRSAHLKAPKSEICAKGQAAPSHLCRCTRSSCLSISPLSLLSSEPSTTAISPDLLQERAGGVRRAQGERGRGGEILEGETGGHAEAPWHLRRHMFWPWWDWLVCHWFSFTFILHTQRAIETDKTFNAITHHIIKYQLSLNSIFDKGYRWLKHSVWILLVKLNSLLQISLNCHVRAVTFRSDVWELSC